MTESDPCIAAARRGVSVRPDIFDQSRWIGSTGARQYGPFDTREEALAAAMRGLDEPADDNQLGEDLGQVVTYVDRTISIYKLLRGLLRLF